jgi:VanZ family protein
MARLRRLQTWIACLLGGYWIGMFIGTHLPKMPKALDTSIPDKTLHYSAFVGLGFLLAAFRASSMRLRVRDLVLLFGILACYGIVDELTQIPVGRTADVFDWFADLIGATTGLLLFAASDFLWRKLSPTPAAPTVRS